MALDVTTNLNDEREAELIALTNEWNRGFPMDQRTPTQHGRALLRDLLDASAVTRAENDRLGLRAALKKATPAEQAQVNAILSKYR